MIYRQARSAGHALKVRTSRTRTVFSEIYRNNYWGDQESVSGRGSTVSRTREVRRALTGLLESVKANSLLDAACGDFNWMQHVDLGQVEYIGVDIVPELITRNRRMFGSKGRTFMQRDIIKQRLPAVDVVLCRDCFIHLSFKDIRSAIDNFKRSNCRYLIATTHSSVQSNTDIETGGWRSVNLELPPFNFPPPRTVIIEDPTLGKRLGMWDLQSLAARPDSSTRTWSISMFR